MNKHIISAVFSALLCNIGVAQVPNPNVAHMVSGVNAQTGTSYTMKVSDTTKLVTFNNAAPVAVTLPSGMGELNTGFGSGSIFLVANLGAGLVTITCSSCTINGSATLSLNQNQGAEIFGDGTNFSAFVGAGGASGNPGGSDKQIQINNAAAFGGITNVAAGSWLSSAGTSAFPVFQTKTVIDVRDYYGGNGVKCDGGSHPLSGFYGSLGAAQAVYPFITSLTQQLDYAAAKAAANAAFGADGSEHGTNTALNKPLQFPAGSCNFGSDELLIRNADGIVIQGAAKTATILQGSGIVLGFDGLWYSKLSDFEVITSSNSAVVAMDVDGNVPGHPYSTRTVQGNLLQNILVGGGGSSYALAFCRQGGNNAQCSEDTMINIHLSNASSAALYINGFNALDNVWIGGDIQTYTTDGIFLSNSTLREVGVSFEPVGGCGQLNNGGFDIHASGGVGGTIIATGSRTEGLSFMSTSSVNAVVSGFQQNPAFSTWTANATVTSAEAIEKTGTDGLPHLFCATTPGTSSNVQPTWPASGTVNDGTAVWTATPFTVINIAGGQIDYTSASIDPAATVAWQNWISALGTYAFTSTGLIGGGSFDMSSNNPSGIAIEHALQAANASFTLDLFSNAHGSPFASQFQTIGNLPASSVGILARGGVEKLYLGDNLFEGTDGGGSTTAEYHLTTALNLDGAGSGLSGTEGTGATVAAGASLDTLWPDSTAHRWKMNNNNGTSTSVAGLLDFASPPAIGNTTPAAGSFTTLSATGQITSTLATGTAPFSITSTTPVSNLTAVPTTYNHSGTQQTATHIVRDRCTLGTDCSVTLSGSAVFTSSSTYDCVGSDRTGAAAILFNPSSGSAFALTGTGTDTISYICVGN